MKSPAIPLCYRCEHRARSLEGGVPPRYECGSRDVGIYCCYMYEPVSPLVTRKVAGDRRPIAPYMVAARRVAVRIAECETHGRFKGKEILFWKKPVGVDAGETGGVGGPRRGKRTS